MLSPFRNVKLARRFKFLIWTMFLDKVNANKGILWCKDDMSHKALSRYLYHGDETCVGCEIDAQC